MHAESKSHFAFEYIIALKRKNICLDWDLFKFKTSGDKHFVYVLLIYKHVTYTRAVVRHSHPDVTFLEGYVIIMQVQKL